MKMKFKIKGIDCANCAAELERTINKIGNPPALPGDSQSLTFTARKKTSNRELLKVQRKEVNQWKYVV